MWDLNDFRLWKCQQLLLRRCTPASTKISRLKKATHGKSCAYKCMCRRKECSHLPVSANITRVCVCVCLNSSPCQTKYFPQKMFFVHDSEPLSRYVQRLAPFTWNVKPHKVLLTSQLFLQGVELFLVS